MAAAAIAFRRTVTQEAVVKRLNRQLTKDQRVIRKSRGQRAESDLGVYYMMDYSLGFVVMKDVDITALAKEYEVLAPGETIEE